MACKDRSASSTSSRIDLVPPHTAQADAKAAAYEHMVSYAAMLVANGNIACVENGPSYPYYKHKLNCSAIFNMFKNILDIIVVMNDHRLGAQSPTDPADQAILCKITNNIAYDALTTMYTVLYNKAARLSFGIVTLFGNGPTYAPAGFPIFVASLINTIGPVRFDGSPSRGTHIPYMVWEDVLAQRPNDYSALDRMRFDIAISRSNGLAFEDAGITTPQYSPWWTFHAYAEPMNTYSLWSPVKFEDCDNAMKLGVLFAKEKITTGFGVVPHAVLRYFRSSEYSSAPPSASNPNSIHYHFVDPFNLNNKLFN